LSERRESGGLTVLKIGGSVITHKELEFSPNGEAIKRLAGELSASLALGRLLIVHGGGSFGHPVASRYSLKSGFSSGAPATALIEVEEAMKALNALVVEEFLRAGLPVFAVQSFVVFKAKGGEVSALNAEIFSRLLSFGLIPVCYGSLVLDDELGYTIVSGDDMAVKLAVELGARSLVFVSDVEGVYDRDPKIHEGARLLKEVSLSRDRPEFGEVRDVTGGIGNKLKKAGPAVEAGIDVRVVSGVVPGRLSSALKGEDVGTKLIP